MRLYRSDDNDIFSICSLIVRSERDEEGGGQNEGSGDDLGRGAAAGDVAAFLWVRDGGGGGPLNDGAAGGLNSCRCVGGRGRGAGGSSWSGGKLELISGHGLSGETLHHLLASRWLVVSVRDAGEDRGTGAVASGELHRRLIAGRRQKREKVDPRDDDVAGDEALGEASVESASEGGECDVRSGACRGGRVVGGEDAVTTLDDLHGGGR